MKRTIKSFLVAAGLAFFGLGSLLTATPVSATPTLVPVTSGGVTCQKYTLDPYPGNENYYYCADPTWFSSIGPGLYTDAQRYKATGANAFGAVMAAAPVEIFLFENQADFMAFFGYSTAPSGLTNQEDGFSERAPTIKTPGVSYGIARPRLVIFRTKAGGINLNGSLSSTMDHEVGHFIDWWIAPSFGGSRQAIKTSLQNTPYTNLVAQDKAALSRTGVYTLCNNVFVSDSRVCNTTTGQPLPAFVGKTPWQVLELLNPYNFAPGSSLEWQELYAEAISAAGNKPRGSAAAGLANDIKNLMKCSWLYSNRRYVNGREPTTVEYTGTTTFRGPACTVPTP